MTYTTVSYVYDRDGKVVGKFIQNWHGNGKITMTFERTRD